MTNSKRLDAAIGIASGAAQGTTIVHAQVLVLIALSLGLQPEQLAWVAPLGFIAPLVANALTVLGDWVSSRTICLWVAGTTLAGALLLAGAGFAIGRADPALAMALVTIGSLMVPAALRHGDLVVAHLTLRSRPEEQIGQGRTLRTFLVIGIYLPALPAGLIAEAHGWPWVFAGYALLNGAGLALMALKLEPAPRAEKVDLRGYLRHFLVQFKDGSLLLTGLAAVLVRALVFAWVTGVPVAMLGRGHSTVMVGLVAAAGLLAAPFVLFRPTRGREQDGLVLLAGAVPISVAIILAAAVFTPAAAYVGAGGAVVYLVLLAVGSGLAEAAKQVGQLMTSYQATLRATPFNRFRRLGVANLGGNLGAMLGAAVGPMTAGTDEQLWWFAIAGLALTYAIVQVVWMLVRR